MKSRPPSKPLALGLLASALAFSGGCSSDPSPSQEAPAPTATVAESPQQQPSPTPTTSSTTPPPPPKPVDNPGPPPSGCSGITKDANGFFTRTNGAASYVGFVPPSYAGKPTTLLVGLHGCGDTAMNFATWAVAPWDTRAAQTHLAISVGGRDGTCWTSKTDGPKVEAAIADMATCFYVHQQRVVLAGYSSGGELAYRLGLTQSSKYAGLLIENSGLAGADPTGATWKINVAHVAHTNDTTFPLAGVRSDWAKLEAAGIPLQKSEVAGDHSGTSDDWNTILLPKMAAWKAP